MGSIYPSSCYGSRSTKDVEFVQCVDCQDPQIHKIWCLGSVGVIREFHLTAQIDVGDGTVGQFMKNYLAENGHRIPVIGQLSINRSVKCLGVTAGT